MIRTVEDPVECEALWKAFSPHERAWDEWDLMYAFHDRETYHFRFLVQTTDGRQDGLVPLVYDARDDTYELFGGCYPDARVLWVAPDHFAEFYDALPDKTSFFDLQGSWVDEVLRLHPEYEPSFSERDERFYLVPAEFGYDFDHHIGTFSSEKRKGFRYDLRKIRERGPVLRWSDNDESERFIDLCNRRFGAESDYALESGRAELKRVVTELRESGWLRTLTIEMDGSIEAVSMSAHYRSNLIALYSASNADYKNLGKLLNVETIQEGCRLRVDEINYMTGMTWKAAWNMKSEPTRTMRKPARPSAPGD